ncbi:FG-GAP repeat protein [Halapricum desulfuricans]|uniref:FG-GAP repeat protein n=1 Tax=Halapricum desulfuricans TaxID=2841257 RepID=UPI001E3DD578|nr:FG-GAP repeat protein [Halapricum desulfuricans]
MFAQGTESWTRQTTLAPDESHEGDYFGDGVALADNGKTAIIGALSDNNSNGERAGAVYVFTRSDGSWAQQAKLLPNDGDSGDTFGFAVAVADDGLSVLIGAEHDGDPNGKGAGSAYVFSRANGSWTQQAKLVPENGDGGDSFGASVALSADGTVALVGAPQDETPHGNESGSVYVFTYRDGSWIRRAKLVPGDGDSNDNFGSPVAVTGDGRAALIGAVSDEDSNGKSPGSAYVFIRDSGDWTQQAKLSAENGNEEEYFGRSVALADDRSTALIGAYDTGVDTGSMYVFSRSDDSWTQQGKLAPDNSDHNDAVGLTVALASNGPTALLGAGWGHGSENTVAAYVFT